MMTVSIVLKFLFYRLFVGCECDTDEWRRKTQPKICPFYAVGHSVYLKNNNYETIPAVLEKWKYNEQK